MPKLQKVKKSKESQREQDRDMLNHFEEATHGHAFGKHAGTDNNMRSRSIVISILFWPMFTLWSLLAMTGGSSVGTSGNNGNGRDREDGGGDGYE